MDSRTVRAAAALKKNAPPKKSHALVSHALVSHALVSHALGLLVRDDALSVGAPRQRRERRDVHRPSARDAMPVASAAKSDAREPENMLVVADNLRAMNEICGDFAGKIRAIYIDPPYNSGRKFVEYDDRKTSEAWRAEIDARLPVMHRLLREDGALACEIDDTELANMTLALDRVFGREQRVATITVARSAATGHKAQNLGPVNVSDYILLYVKDRKKARLHTIHRARDGLDPAYATVIENPDAPARDFKFAPLRAHVAKLHGHASASRAKIAMGKDAFARAVETWALTHARAVVRFAEPRYEAVGKRVRSAIDDSREHPTRVITLTRKNHKPLVLKGGNRILFLADKVRTIDGAPSIVEPLTTVWSDVPFQGIAREGGVVFVRNKKPERLLHRLLSMMTDPGDWVLDPYLGSGTTAAVAHKMGRRWIGIESGAHAIEMARARLVAVVNGQDATGVSKELGFKGGGSFGVYR